MKRSTRPAVAVLAMALVSGGLAVAGAAPASAAQIGNVTVSPTTGNDQTLFGGSADISCPANTDDGFFDIKGADIGELGDGTTTGSGGLGFLAAADAPYTGTKTFSGASISNLRSTNAGAFASNGAYRIRFRCESNGVTLATYEATMNYTAGGAGAYTIAPPPVAARATSTTLSASPAGPFEAGTLTDLTADVTPTTGADDATGSVEFFNGTTSLGVDNTLTGTGVATLAGVALPTGSNALTAVYTPASASFTSSTSPTVTVSVTPVAPRSTTTVLTVSPVSGPAYTATTLTCAVSATTGTPNGTAVFKDGATTLGSSPLSSGAATLVSSNFAPGAHSFTCDFTGVAPYNNSSSAAVPASYDVSSGAVPFSSNVVVTIPQGALTITTPYTVASPLTLGTAVLDAATSTYSASAPLADITITDNRAGNLGWSASLVAGAFSNGTSSFGGDRAGLTGLAATQVPTNALLATDVVLTNTAPASPGLGTAKAFASYAAGKPTGTAKIAGTFGLAGVPTSVTPGTYTSTVVFTAA